MKVIKKLLSLFRSPPLREGWYGRNDGRAYDPTYQRGDHVQSIYGGPVMTVSEDQLLWVGGRIGVPRVWVVWYDKNMAIHKQRFQHSELKRVP